MNSMVDIIGRNVAHIEAPCGEENLSVCGHCGNVGNQLKGLNLKSEVILDLQNEPGGGCWGRILKPSKCSKFSSCRQNL